MKTDVVQRWKERRGIYLPAREVIDTRAYEVASIPDDTTAKAFVLEHHYSSSYPNARFRYGLYRVGRLVGVAVFSHPMQDKVLDRLPKGQDEVLKLQGPWLRRGRFGTEVTTSRLLLPLPGHRLESVELGRLVLLDEELANAESYFVAQCFERLRREGITGVVSFSDPMPRWDDQGNKVHVGHLGIVYQALKATFTGRATPRTLKMLHDGTVLNERAISKVRGQERGHEHVEALIVRNGAQPCGPRTDPRVWLARWLPRIARNVRHHGNLTYLFGLTESVKRRLPTSQAYPKFILGASA